MKHKKNINYIEIASKKFKNCDKAVDLFTNAALINTI
jgi:hypothetical protein